MFLPSPGFAVRRSLVRAAGAAARCYRPHWSLGGEREKEARRSELVLALLLAGAAFDFGRKYQRERETRTKNVK